jgi:hypothetical protein
MSETHNPLQKVITKCWEDEAFKEKLLADPAATLQAEGVEVPEGVTVNVAVDTEAVRTLVIPLPPVGALGDDEIETVYAGKPDPMPCVSRYFSGID